MQVLHMQKLSNSLKNIAQRLPREYVEAEDMQFGDDEHVSSFPRTPNTIVLKV